MIIKFSHDCLTLSVLGQPDRMAA